MQIEFTKGKNGENTELKRGTLRKRNQKGGFRNIQEPTLKPLAVQIGNQGPKQKTKALVERKQDKTQKRIKESNTFLTGISKANHLEVSKKPK